MNDFYTKLETILFNEGHATPDKKILPAGSEDAGKSADTRFLRSKDKPPSTWKSRKEKSDRIKDMFRDKDAPRSGGRWPGKPERMPREKPERKPLKGGTKAAKEGPGRAGPKSGLKNEDTIKGYPEKGIKGGTKAAKGVAKAAAAKGLAKKGDVAKKLAKKGEVKTTHQSGYEMKDKSIMPQNSKGESGKERASRWSGPQKVTPRRETPRASGQLGPQGRISTRVQDLIDKTRDQAVATGKDPLGRVRGTKQDTRGTSRYRPRIHKPGDWDKQGIAGSKAREIKPNFGANVPDTTSVRSEPSDKQRSDFQTRQKITKAIEAEKALFTRAVKKKTMKESINYYISLASLLAEKQDPGKPDGDSHSWTGAQPRGPKKKYADEQSIKVSTKHRAQGHNRSIKSTTPSKPFGDKPSFRGDLAKRRAEAYKFANKGKK